MTCTGVCRGSGGDADVDVIEGVVDVAGDVDVVVDVAAEVDVRTVDDPNNDGNGG